jgi:malate/lactate dehydrogenase
MEKIIEYDLNEEERAEFDKSAEAVKELHDALKNLVEF